MKFQKGDLVWHGWHPTPSRGDWVDRRLMQGEVIGYFGILNYDYCGPQKSFSILWQDGEAVVSPEFILTKIPPEEHDRHKEKEDQKPVETV